MLFSEVTKPNGFFKSQPNENTYALHQYVWSLFGGAHKSDKREFLYSLYNGKLYIVSVKEPVDTESEDTIIRTHQYQPEFSKGQTLRFDIRLNAEIRRKKGAKRVSIVTAQRIEEGDDFDGNWDRIAHEGADQWFIYKAEKLGFKVKDFRILNRHHYNFKNAKEDTIKFISLDIQGILEVTGPAVFAYTLHNGLGQSRGIGCGLMLVAP